jgi:hypothetical protein
MWHVGKILFLLVLAGCSSSSDWFARPEPRPEPVVSEPAPQAGPGQPAASQSAPPPGNLTPAARAAAPGTAVGGELLDCVTDSCKVNCSPKVPKQYRPKWCARFKEPEQ